MESETTIQNIKSEDTNKKKKGMFFGKGCRFSQRYVKNQLDEKDKRLHAEMQYLNQHFHNHIFQKAPKIYQHGKEEPYKEANIEYIYDKPQRHKKEDFLYINKSYKEKLPGDR